MVCAGFLLLLPFVLACFLLLLQQQFRFSPQTVGDLIAIIRLVDERELEDLLDQAKEDNLRAGITAHSFRKAQRARARLLFEYLRRMGFNAMAVLVWSYAEQERLRSPGMPTDPEQARSIDQIVA